MKRLFPILLFLALWLAGCRSTDGRPEKVARLFLEYYYANDYEKAMVYADETTAQELQVSLNQLELNGITAEERKSLAVFAIIEVEGIIANDGYQAVCAYKVKNAPDDANAMIETLLLVKTEEGWKASF